MADLLANIAIKPNEVTFTGLSKVDIQTRPIVPNNVQNWQEFDSDKDILKFLNCEDQFSRQEIDFAALVEIIDGKDTIFGNQIVQLNTSKILMGLVVLETIFDCHDRSEVSKKELDAKDLEEINLEIDEAPKKVYIGKKLKPKIR